MTTDYCSVWLPVQHCGSKLWIVSILTNLPGVCCFVDDILVAAKTETEHLNRLKAVFKRLQENDVLIKPEKCVFMTKEISYLGFKITKVYLKLMKK